MSPPCNQLQKVRTFCPKVRTNLHKVRTSCPKVRTNLREGADRMAYYNSITTVQTAEETPGHDKGFAKAHRYLKVPSSARLRLSDMVICFFGPDRPPGPGPRAPPGPPSDRTIRTRRGTRPSPRRPEGPGHPAHAAEEMARFTRVKRKPSATMPGGTRTRPATPPGRLPGSQ